MTASASDPDTAALVQRWITTQSRRLANNPEWEQRTAHLAQAINRTDPDHAAPALGRILERCFHERSRPSKILAEAILLCLLEERWPREHRDRSREAAAGLDEHLAGIYLREVRIPEDDDEETERDAPEYGGERPLTLGERRFVASRPSRRIIERAMLDPHPMVVEKLLANPRLTEADVVSMAARRPTRSGALVEIARHPRWRARRRVALSLVHNPALSLGVSATLLPFVSRREMIAIGRDGNLLEQLRELATLFLGVRE